jgi:hypothetical protein
MRLDSKPEWMKAEARLISSQPESDVSAEKEYKRWYLESEPSHTKRRSIFVGVPPLRPSWPDRKSVLMLKDRSQMDPVHEVDRVMPIEPAKEVEQGHQVERKKPAYVDAGVQTDTSMAELHAQEQIAFPKIGTSFICLPPRHTVPIGCMSDFFRGQYRLGDALRYV